MICFRFYLLHPLSWRQRYFMQARLKSGHWYMPKACAILAPFTAEEFPHCKRFLAKWQNNNTCAGRESCHILNGKANEVYQNI